MPNNIHGPLKVAITARKTISRSNALFFCSSNLRALYAAFIVWSTLYTNSLLISTVVSATSVGIIFLITVTFEILIGRTLAQRAKIQQLSNVWGASNFFIRIALFTAYLLLSVA
jgi:hypothetical protein